MTDGRGEGPRELFRHVLVERAPTSERFQRRGGGGNPPAIYGVAHRERHSANLREGIEQATAEDMLERTYWPDELRAEGVVLEVVGWPGGFELALESLDLRGSGIELLSFSAEVPDAGRPESASVFVPDRSIGQFFRRLDQYANENTRNGRPKNEPLVANIAAMRRAALESLWTDSNPFPVETGPLGWEVWLRRTGHELRTLGLVAESAGWLIARRALEFPDRTVTAIYGTRESLGQVLASALPLAELRHPNLVKSLLELPRDFQRDLVVDLRTRLNAAPNDAPAVCLLDTGIYQHSAFIGSLVPGDIGFVVGADGVDREGHGTELAGIALMGDLARALTTLGPINLLTRLESVKILPDPGQPPNHPETYGAVTADGVSVPEVTNPERRRVFNIACSSSDSLSDGRPTLWSATVDALAFGTDVVRAAGGLQLLSAPAPDNARLLVVAAGNVRNGYSADYLEVSDLAPVEDPGQAWNALTVGAYTELDGVPGDPDFRGYRALAGSGQLSPFSRTSVLFGSHWPIKPDVVLEGGNLLIGPGGDTTTHDLVSLVTTSYREPEGRPLTTTNATSAASAQASRLAALAVGEYPGLWPETIKGLVVHAAEWTPSMLEAFDGVTNRAARQRLVRRYGFGVPSEERVLASLRNSVTMIEQAHIQPFVQRPGEGAKLREMHLVHLPWPRDELLALGNAEVRMRVTLSYFVEPNPSSRGWRGRYVYPSHGLRFDIRRSTESSDEFRRRLNRVAELEEGRAPEGVQEPNWFLGPTARSMGALHADIWTGSAADLANSGMIGVYPVGGWWKNNNRRDRTDLAVRYALLVSLRAEVGVDLITPIATAVGIPLEVRAA